MTGPEHYAEAERLLAVCAGDQRGSELDAACTSAAQVHATLALAAATVEATPSQPPAEWGWAEVLGR